MTENHDQSLFDAVLSEDYKESQFLLSIGANPNRLFNQHGGISAFHIAVGLKNDLKFTRLFINYKADVNLRSKQDGWTPLHVCAYWNKHESLRLLLLSKADPFKKDKNGQTPLQIAVKNYSKECIRMLKSFANVAKETDINDEDDTLPEPNNHIYYNANEPIKIAQTPVKTAPAEKPNESQIKNLESLINNMIEAKLEEKRMINSLNQQISSPTIDSVPPVNSTPTFIKTLNREQNRNRDNQSPALKNNQTTQTKINGKRFYSPERPPEFYRSLADVNRQKPVLESPRYNNSPCPSSPPAPPRSQPPSMSTTPNMNDSSTQTTGKLVRVNLQDLEDENVPRTSGYQTKTLSTNVLNKLNSKLTKQNENDTPEKSVSSSTDNTTSSTLTTTPKSLPKNLYMNKFRYWLTKLSSPLIGTFNSTTSSTGSSTIIPELSRESRATQINHISKTTSIQSISIESVKQINDPTNQLYSTVNSSKTQQVKTTTKTKLTTYNNDLVTDRIGEDFFNNVLGDEDGPIRIYTSKKQVFNQSMANQQLVSRAPTATMETEFVDLDENLAFRETFITNDESHNEFTIMTNDDGTLVNDYENDDEYEDDTLKTSGCSYKTACDEELDHYVAMLDNEIDYELNEHEKTMNKKLINNSNVIAQVARIEGNYSQELMEELTNKLNMTNTSEIIEKNMFTCFRNNTGEKWREGNVKSAFNYLLIDPRITRNLPSRAKYLNEKEVFRIFISSIFYVGKGSRDRPYAHMYDTLKYWKDMNDNKPIDKQKISKKIKKITEIWNDSHGVVSLHCFQSVIPSEAYTREASMIDAIGLEQLTNMKKGNYYGEAKDWTPKRKRQLGVILLRRACAIFLAEGERQISPIDLKPS